MRNNGGCYFDLHHTGNYIDIFFLFGFQIECKRKIINKSHHRIKFKFKIGPLNDSVLFGKILVYIQGRLT